MSRYSGRSSAQGARSMPPSTVSRAGGGAARSGTGRSTSSRVGTAGWGGAWPKTADAGKRAQPAARTALSGSSLAMPAIHPPFYVAGPEHSRLAEAANAESNGWAWGPLEPRVELADMFEEGARPLHQPRDALDAQPHRLGQLGDEMDAIGV